MLGLICLGLVFTGCPTDSEADTTNPKAGGSGTLTVSNLGATSADLGWTAGTDEGSSKLSYKVVTASTAEAIDTAEKIDVMTGSAVIKDWSTKLTTVSLSGLTPKTTYYVNVAVKDESDNLAVYKPVKVTTLPERIYLFVADRVDGNMGGRTGANSIVSNSPMIPPGVTETVAFLSVSSDDQLCEIPKNYSFPTNVPIYIHCMEKEEEDGEYKFIVCKIADNWTDLMDGTINTPLVYAGLFPHGKDNPWWSGSNSDGTVSSYTCKAWTDKSDDSLGMAGAPDKKDKTWLSDSSYAGTRNLFILGLGY